MYSRSRVQRSSYYLKEPFEFMRDTIALAIQESSQLKILRASISTDGSIVNIICTNEVYQELRIKLIIPHNLIRRQHSPAIFREISDPAQLQRHRWQRERRSREIKGNSLEASSWCCILNFNEEAAPKSASTLRNEPERRKSRCRILAILTWS